MHACTVISRSHLARARVLARSFLEHHPGSTVHALVLDPGPPLREPAEPFEVVVPQDLFTLEEWGPLWFACSTAELTTAVQPRLLGQILGRYEETATYLDPGIRLYRSMDRLEELAGRHAVVFCPRVARPLPRDDRMPTELDVLRAGAYDPGLLSVGREARPFLDWWRQRVEQQCRMVSEQGDRIGQPWVDLAPALFDCVVLKDATMNVSYWNLGERRLTTTGDGYLVDGEPLTSFHFSGYDPRFPWLLSRQAGRSPRTLLSESPALRRLCDEYATELLAAGHDEAASCQLDRATLPGGVVLDERARRVYRGALTPADSSRRLPEAPNPVASPAEFVAWLREPEDPGHPAWLSRYLFRMYLEQRRLRRAFPRVPGEDLPRFLTWVRRHGAAEAGIPTALLPPAEIEAPSALSARPVAAGVNVVGYLRAEVGVGEQSRQMAEAVRKLGVPLATFDAAGSVGRQQHPFSEERPFPDLVNPFDINIVCITLGMRRFAVEMGPQFFAGRYTVGYWAWELEEVPPSWSRTCALVDEVWMISEHAAAGVRRLTTKPVHVFPIPVRTPTPGPVDRRALGLPDGYVFLFMFDYGSVFERKNPVGLVRAFKQAFAPGEGPVLVLKSIKGELHLNERERLRYEVEGRPDIRLMERYLTAGERDALVALCDCYVSLHRAEGFGITMAEAMALGKPTIATGYSGNLDFMTPQNSYLVGYQEARVPAGCPPYPAGAKWAEPDLEEAAALLQRVYTNRAAAREVGERARQDMARLHTPEARVHLLEELLASIRTRPVTSGPPVAAGPPAAMNTAAACGTGHRVVERSPRSAAGPEPGIASEVNDPEVILVSNDVVPGMGLPVAGPGLRVFGLGEGLRRHGFRVVTVVDEAPVQSLRSGEGPSPLPPDTWVVPTREIGDFVASRAPAVVVLTNYRSQIYGLRPSPGLHPVIDLFAPKMLEIACSSDREDGIRALAALRERKLRAIASAEGFIVNGNKKIPYFLAWLLQAGKDPLTTPLEPVFMCVPAHFRPSKDAGEGVRFVVAGYLQGWSLPGPWLDHLVDHLVSPHVTLDVLLPAHWGRRRRAGVSSGRGASLPGRPGVNIHGMMTYDEYLEFMGRVDVAVDLFERTLEREYAVVTRSVVALACGVPVVHPPFTEVSPLIGAYDAGWLVDPGDLEAVDAVVEEIIGHPEVVAAKAANARRLWQEVLDPEVAVRPLVKLARRLAAK